MKKRGELLILDESGKCPKCRVRRDNVTGFCHNCGVKLFSNQTYDFKKFEDETAIRNWWAWDSENGWMYRDFFMIEKAKPLSPVIKIDPKALDKNYGRTTTPAKVSQAFKKPENRIRHRRTK
jgi:hypothetical protein